MTLLHIDAATLAELPQAQRASMEAAASHRDGNGLWIPPKALTGLVSLSTVKTEPSEPTLAELAGNFAHALARWCAAGCPVVAQADYDARLAICQACPNWVQGALFARCRICGCRVLKLWLATERCPDKPTRWPPLTLLTNTPKTVKTETTT